MNATLNLISLMGLAIGVGMLTDNAVVVVDNIYRHVQGRGKDVKKASFIGTKKFFFDSCLHSHECHRLSSHRFHGRNYEGNVSRDGLGDYFFQSLAALIVSLSLIPMLSAQFFDRRNLLQSGGKYFHRVKYIRKS